MSDIEKKPSEEFQPKETDETVEQIEADENLSTENDDETEVIIFNKILMGAFDDSIPEPKRKLVRIFTSSTFTGKFSKYSK